MSTNMDFGRDVVISLAVEKAGSHRVDAHL